MCKKGIHLLVKSKFHFALKDVCIYTKGKGKDFPQHALQRYSSTLS